MKKIERSFCPADRYKYDFGRCSSANGWAQIDTRQDASYFGSWINPTERKTLSYCEGDVTECSFDTDAELVEEIERIDAWHKEDDERGVKIDPGFNVELKQALVAAGLEKYIH